MKTLALLLTTVPVLAHAEQIAIPLRQRRDQDSTSNLASRSDGPSFNAMNPLTFGTRHWWYGNFTIGKSQNLELQIDSASGAIGINPGRYEPSEASVELNRTFNPETGDFGYGTMLKDGCGTASFTGQAYTDTLTLPGGLTIEDQAFGVFNESPGRPVTKDFPHDGIAGLSFGGIGHIGWFQKLCKLPQLKECRMGLALGTSGAGRQILGGVDDSLFDGNLTTITTSLDPLGWPVNFVVNGTQTIISNSAVGQFDSGTANINGPAAEVQKIFDAVGVQSVELQPGWMNCTKRVIVGYYPCNKPPQVGIHFLSDTNGDEVFEIEPEAFQMTDNGNNNCTAIITGSFGDDAWRMGQAWFQGKYVDFNWEGVAHSVAKLKDKSVGAHAATNVAQKMAGPGLLTAFLLSVLLAGGWLIL